MHKIIVELSVGSIDKAIKEIKEYKKWVEDKTQELVKKLADVGLKEATLHFNTYPQSDVSVYVKEKQNGYSIIASGEEVCFIEFGAGVYYNGSEPYPKPRPNGIVGIGEYGKGKGKQETWGYYADDGQLVLTHGTMANMPMYYGTKAMLSEVTRIAKEVFR